MGGLGLVPARTMRATAADCLLSLSSQAIRKHLRDRGVGAGVAPEFLAKHNSQLVGIRDGAPTTPSVSRLATSTSLVKAGPTPAFVLARVSPLADGVAAYVGQRQRERTVLLRSGTASRRASSRGSGRGPADASARYPGGAQDVTIQSGRAEQVSRSGQRRKPGPSGPSVAERSD
jgi:hypothetical protein